MSCAVSIPDLFVSVFEERLVVTSQLFHVKECRIRRSTVPVPVEMPLIRRIMCAVIDCDTSVAPAPERARI